MLAPITTAHYLVLSAILLLIGVVGILTRRNVIVLMMSIEIILNAVNVNLCAQPRSAGGAGLRHLRHLRGCRRGGGGAGHSDRAVPEQRDGAGGRDRPAEVVGARA